MQKIGFCDKYSLTQAVLNGIKTMTRRVEKALERAVTEYEKKWGKPFSIVSQYYDRGYDKIGICTPNEPIYLSTRYKLNEVVAVAQSYSTVLKELEDPRNCDCMEHWESTSAKRAHYAELVDFPSWNNKLFVSPSEMIHQIQIMDVSIERLQAITDEDCLKEGVYYDADVDGYKVANLSLPNKGFRGDCLRQKYFFTPRAAFAALINRPGVGRKGLWESNPWVVVYEFKLVK